MQQSKIVEQRARKFVIGRSIDHQLPFLHCQGGAIEPPLRLHHRPRQRRHDQGECEAKWMESGHLKVSPSVMFT